MLFLIGYKPKPGRLEAEDQRVLNLFVKWKPPAGITIKSHYIRADGGGLVIVEADSAVAMVEANATWIPFLDYEAAVPIVEISEALPALQRVAAWRESVK
jgi:hypothetical protein